MTKKIKPEKDASSFLDKKNPIRIKKKEIPDKGIIAVKKKPAIQNKNPERQLKELILANKKLTVQNKEKEKLAAKLIIENKTLNDYKAAREKHEKELILRATENGKRAAELLLAGQELEFNNRERENLEDLNKKIEAFSDSLKSASQYSLSLIEASRDPLFTVNPEGKITDINKATVDITNVTREHLIGTDFFEYFTEPEKAREIYQQVFTKGFVADYPLTIRDGKLTEVLFNGKVYKDVKGKVMGVVVVARDNTDHLRIEKKLLEAKVFAELATGLAVAEKIKAENAMQKSEEAMKAKQQFLSNMSHEIRTPLNSIIGFTKVLMKTELTEKQKEYLTAIKLSGDSLIVLLNDILDMAKVDAGKMVFEHIPFRMTLSVSSVLYLFEIKAREKNIELIRDYDSNIPDVLIGDPARLHQILINLLSNALKFTTKGKITVTARRVHEDNENAVIEFSVADTGIGIAEDKLDAIFEKFQQAASDTSRLFGGTGLGLPIVKFLVEKQGGTLDIKSKIGEGATFSFSLPFKKTSERLAVETEKPAWNHDKKNLNILLVEDIPLNQLLIKTLLEDYGFEHDDVFNGKSAIEKLQKKPYDIVLMDLHMPVMNGFEATNYIRNTLKSKVPIIALTADVTTVDLEKCKSAGMNDYISKPVDERLLYSKIIEWVDKPLRLKRENKKEEVKENNEEKKYTDLTYMTNFTKGNSKMMIEIISLYLEQTPVLIREMKQDFLDKNWEALREAVHKILPSFVIAGIDREFENTARKIQEYAASQLRSDEIYQMVLLIEKVCMQACRELQEDLNTLKVKAP